MHSLLFVVLSVLLSAGKVVKFLKSDQVFVKVGLHKHPTRHRDDVFRILVKIEKCK